MINKLLLSFIGLFITSLLFSQTVNGVVLDAKSNQPIESVSIYFDNTTIGTTTDADGEFSIDYNESIKSLLIISHIGYFKSVIRDYSPSKKYKVLLEEDINILDEVIVTHDDGMPRKLKLSEFKKQFLGSSNNASSCKIINEEDIILRYFTEEKQLTASSRKPIRIRNKNLQYIISYDLRDFKIDYSYVNIEKKQLHPKMVLYTGTSRYEDLEKSHKNSVKKNRKKSYRGSSLHFLRALTANNLKQEGYSLLKDGKTVNVEDYFFITQNKRSKAFNITLKDDVGIWRDGKVSALECKVDKFLVDQFGNHSPIDKVIFSGYMGSQRLGDSVPLNYKLIED
ncbi:MAG: hypothetical protein HKO72_08450 [Flavobacteriaceae bacterium]|nr:carboxypeptidase-like regulatory domain-containing protein [Bacteroidia bacterium]NNL61349.1 hypothetical protein [Flavobacteriaceae bacterium]